MRLWSRREGHLRALRGPARKDRLTKRLVGRLRPGEIALIAHRDLDEAAAEELAGRKPAAILNALDSATGSYPNLGPDVLLRARIPLVDRLGEQLLEQVKEGEDIRVEGATVRVNGLEFQGRLFTRDHLEEAQRLARLGLGEALEEFITNTLDHIRKEGHSLVERPSLPPLKTELSGRQCVVVSRSNEYERDLAAILPYIKERRPVLIGVDGATDGILRKGLRPHIVFGDMDSISDAGLRSGAEIVVHGYTNGEAPGSKRVKQLGLRSEIFCCPGTSEDAALLLAYYGGADLVVSVGSRWSLEEFLGRGRKGMASSYLTRVRIASRLVDARGVSRLRPWSGGSWHIAGLALSGLLAVAVIMAFSPFARGFFELAGVQLRMVWRAVARALPF